ncbi:MAG: CDP-alcohol phosphatidyltransferase family protein [Planctomycetes bacterium]|nr:CDP-alcohol phosphatidyltransferase family protein [Planctomycetota bacterium]
MNVETRPRVRRAVVVAPAEESAKRVVGMTALERLLKSARRAGIERVLVVPPGGGAQGATLAAGDPALGDVTWAAAAGEERQRTVETWFEAGEPVLVLDAGSWLSIDFLKELANGPAAQVPVLVTATARAGAEDAGAQRVRVNGTRVEGLGGAPGVEALVTPGAALVPAEDVASLGFLLRSPADAHPLELLARGGRMEHRPAGKAPWRSLRGEGACARAETALLHSLIKDSDGFMARNFDRYISLTLSRRLVSTPLTPNAITLLATAIGIGSALAFAGGSYASTVLGGLLFVVSTIIDGCDGEVARLRMVDSKAGYYFDMIADNVVYVSIFIGITLGLGRLHPTVNYLLPCLVLITGLLINGLVFWIGILRRDIKDLPPVLAGFERIANGDFSYIVLAFALSGHMEWFLWGAAVGTHVFWMTLTLLLVLEAWAARGPGSAANCGP